jgi:hypothetical protein
MISAKNYLRKLYKISLKSAFLISLPLISVLAWVITDTYLDFQKYNLTKSRNNSMERMPLNSDIFHAYLKNKFKEFYLKAAAPMIPLEDKVPTFHITMTSQSIQSLNENLPDSGRSTYYTAFLNYMNETYEANVRYIGDNNWHWLYPKKSFRIKIKKKGNNASKDNQTKLLKNVRSFNLKVPRFLWLMNDLVGSELAAEMGIHTGLIFPVKVSFNNVYAGLYFFQERIDEVFLRRNRLMPGSIYSGDFAPKNAFTGVCALWENETYWDKDASRSSEQKNNREDMASLIKAINSFTLEKFYQYCQTHLDNDHYARYLALDNYIGCNHHDFGHNHKFYFDPYKGKFYPVYWDVGEIALLAKRFDLIGNGLLNKWKLIPHYELLRQKTLFRLMEKDKILTPEKVHSKLAKNHQLIENALHADTEKRTVARDLSRVLLFPASSPSMLFLMKDYYQMLHQFKQGIVKRDQWIKEYLQTTDIVYDYQIKDNYTVLNVISQGPVGGVLKELIADSSADALEVYRDMNHNGILDKADILIAKTAADNKKSIYINESLLSGYKKVEHISDSAFLAGDHVMEVSPIKYTYIVKPLNGTIRDITLNGENILSAEPVNFSREDISVINCRETLSLHPWKITESPDAVSVNLGPGTVTLNQTAVYPHNTALTIQPGTTLLLGKDVSIFCYGRVEALGTKENPIIFKTLNENKPWGVFAARGKWVSGSIFKYCQWSGGSIDKRDLIQYSGMVTIADVENILVEHCTFGKNFIGDDALHINYSSGTVRNCTFIDAGSDAFDLDICNLIIEGCKFLHSGNDGLDCMTSRAVIRNCYFYLAGDKGISVGEESHLTVEGNVFEKCRIGIQIKDNSQVNYGKNIILESPVAIDLYRKNWRYASGGYLQADIIYINDSLKHIKADKASKVDYTELRSMSKDLLIPFYQQIITNAGVKN